MDNIGESLSTAITIEHFGEKIILHCHACKTRIKMEYVAPTLHWIIQVANEHEEQDH